jgi:hypothetical protein
MLEKRARSEQHDQDFKSTFGVTQMKKTTRSDSDILADTLRKCYQFERNQLARRLCRPDGYRVPKIWQSGSREKKGKSLFHKLALFCQRRKIDPIHYIQWCLHLNQVLLGGPPEPNQLLNPKKMTAYLESQHKLQQACLISLKLETDSAGCEWNFKSNGSSPADAWAIVLLNERLELSPLLRYVYAFSFMNKRFDKIAHRYEAAAMLQYQANSEIYERCKIMKLLPPDFAERAAHYYEQLLDKEP